MKIYNYWKYWRRKNAIFLIPQTEKVFSEGLASRTGQS